MSKPSFLSAMGLIIKIVVLAPAVAYYIEKDQALKALPFMVGNAEHNVIQVVVFWLNLLAQGFYLCALWPASTVFARLGKGDAFGPAMVKGMRDVGLNLMLGAVAALILVPLFVSQLDVQYRGIPHPLDIQSITIGFIGLVLYLLARQGQALKSELEQFV